MYITLAHTIFGCKLSQAVGAPRTYGRHEKDFVIYITLNDI